MLSSGTPFAPPVLHDTKTMLQHAPAGATPFAPPMPLREAKKAGRTISGASSVWTDDDDDGRSSCSSGPADGCIVPLHDCPAHALELLLRADCAHSPRLFPALHLASIEGLSTLRELKASPAIQRLEQILHDALGQRPRVGYNPGTGELSVTIPLDEASDDCELPTELRKHDDCDETRALVVQTMLGLYEGQEALERQWQSCDGKDSELLLANRCLLLFAEQSGVGIVDRRINLLNQTLRLTVAASANKLARRVDGVRFTDDHRELFQYHASYFLLTGGDIVDGEWCFSESARKSQHEEFTAMMLDEFWEEVNRCNYFPTAELKDTASRMLREYLHSGVDARRLSSRFSPAAPLRLYLHGTAGVGKSSFTQTLAASLQHVLQRFIEPTRRVDLVKCPLNSISPENLRAMLHVQGISDWSIERVLEQTLRRGDVATFHLEEAPEDPTLQAELFSLIDGMVESLLTKYPERRSNMIFIAVSNYQPAPQVAQRYTVLEMAPPARSWQLAWCTDMLSRTVEATTGLDRVVVELNAAPNYTPDMRPLETWRHSVGFHISEHVNKRLALADRAHSNATVLIRWAPHHCASERNLRVTVGLSARPSDSPGDSAALDSFNLTTQDGFRYHDEMSVQPRGPAAVRLAEYGIQPGHRADVTTVVSMLAAEYLKPAVFVLTGSTAAQSRTAAGIERYIRTLCDPELAELHTSITSMEDKPIIFGKPGEVRGGMCKFIDDVTNPAEIASAEHRRFALITATATEEGQYILREMLENNTSRTHRHVARKGRVAFIVCVPEGCELRPETRSRAHCVLRCEETSAAPA